MVVNKPNCNRQLLWSCVWVLLSSPARDILYCTFVKLLYIQQNAHKEVSLPFGDDVCSLFDYFKTNICTLLMLAFSHTALLILVEWYYLVEAMVICCPEVNWHWHVLLAVKLVASDDKPIGIKRDYCRGSMNMVILQQPFTIQLIKVSLVQ